MVTIVQQDAVARSVVWQSFASIRNLAIRIHEGAGTVMELKGSFYIFFYQFDSILKHFSSGSLAAIRIAQKTISTGLDDLNVSIVAAHDLSTAALVSFEEKINTLFHMIGQKGADYINQKVDIHRQLEEKYTEKKKIMDEFGKQKGNFSSSSTFFPTVTISLNTLCIFCRLHIES